MCGRYLLSNSAALRAEMERLTGLTFEEYAPRPRYNVSPSQLNPVVATDPGGRPRAALMRWGLVPFWDQSEKPKFAPINARSEEMLGKPTFRQSVQQRRCVVPADGFFEWKRPDAHTKLPYCIGLTDGAPFFMAGIHEAATPTRPETFALLTVGPNELMRPIHDRMPVILDEPAARRWLEPGPMTPEKAASLCVPYPATRMRAYPVSTLVNNPRNDLPECIEPVLG
jgi:putative SOS response-associated peptidase YedK